MRAITLVAAVLFARPAMSAEPVDVEQSVRSFFDRHADRYDDMRERLKKDKVTKAEREWLADGKRRPKKSDMYRKLDDTTRQLRAMQWVGGAKAMPWLDDQKLKVGDVGKWPAKMRVAGRNEHGLYVTTYTLDGRGNWSFLLSGVKPQPGHREVVINRVLMVVTDIREIAGGEVFVIEPLPSFLLRTREEELLKAKKERIKELEASIARLKKELAAIEAAGK